MIKRARELAASPVYLLAFGLHLLCAGCIWLAQWIAADLTPKAGKTGVVAPSALAVFIVSNITSAFCGWIAGQPKLDSAKLDKAQYVIMERSPVMDVTPAHFTQEQLVWVPGSMIFHGCLFAQEAIKIHFPNHDIGFDPCHSERRDIKLSDDFRDLSMTMTAAVDGKPASFDVRLQHNPPSTGGTGYRLLSLMQH
jgi:hypothetical protein